MVHSRIVSHSVCWYVQYCPNTNRQSQHLLQCSVRPLPRRFLAICPRSTSALFYVVPWTAAAYFPALVPGYAQPLSVKYFCCACFWLNTDKYRKSRYASAFRLPDLMSSIIFHAIHCIRLYIGTCNFSPVLIQWPCIKAYLLRVPAPPKVRNYERFFLLVCKIIT